MAGRGYIVGLEGASDAVMESEVSVSGLAQGNYLMVESMGFWPEVPSGFYCPGTLEVKRRLQMERSRRRFHTNAAQQVLSLSHRMQRTRLPQYPPFGSRSIGHQGGASSHSVYRLKLLMSPPYQVINALQL